MKTNLKQAINNKLDAGKLSKEQLKALHTRLNQTESNNKASSPSRNWFMAASFASLALFSISLVFFMQGKPADMPQLIAGEVVRNHLKLKPLEVSASSIEKIRVYFDKLNFLPIKSLNVSDTSTLIGGRYCSLQGYTAAQLRMVNPASGNLDTLYQAPYIETVYGKLPDLANNEMPLVVYERGIKVDESK